MRLVRRIKDLGYDVEIKAAARSAGSEVVVEGAALIPKPASAPVEILGRTLKARAVDTRPEANSDQAA